MRKQLLCAGIWLVLCMPFATAQELTIQQVNVQVAEIIRHKQDYHYIDIKLEVGHSEGVPPQIYFYYDAKSGQPRYLHAVTGHETFAINYYYYFFNDKVIKYLKTYDGLDEKKTAIIYNSKGEVLWKNTQQPVLSLDAVQRLYQSVMSALQAFTGY